MPLQDIPVGINIHNVEIQPGGGGKIARSAGASVTISGMDGNYSLIKLSSGEVRKLILDLATIGVLSNPDQKNIKIGKAGRSRWLGRRPHTRGLSKTLLITLMVEVKVSLLVVDILCHQPDSLQKD